MVNPTFKFFKNKYPIDYLVDLLNLLNEKLDLDYFGLMSAWCCTLPKYINRTWFESKIIFQIGDINQSLNPQPTSNLWLVEIGWHHQAWHNFAPLDPFMLYDVTRGFHNHHSNENSCNRLNEKCGKIKHM